MRKITNEMMQQFKAYLYEEEKSDNTIEKYMRDIRFFKAWVKERVLDKMVVLEYKKDIIDKYAPASVNSMLSSLNAFFVYMNWYDMKVKSLRIQRRIFADKTKELTKAEYEKLLKAAKKQPNEQLYYLMQSIASTGIRISELSAISVEAIKTGQATINCKGKLRKIFLPKELCRMLNEYAKKKKIKSGPIFVTRTGKPLDRTRAWKLLKDLCKIAKVAKEKVFPHNFRHLFAKTFYSLQKDIVRLADILGHSSVNTTRIYTIESGDVHMKQLQKLGLLKAE